MSKSKLTLIVDGNWLLMSRMTAIYNSCNDSDELAKELKLLLVRSINLVLKQFPVIDNIIFVSDGGSWRNNIPVPEFLQKDGIEYKGNREKSDSIDWNLVFSIFEDFIDILKTSGINTCKDKGIEGDDWCWYWSTKLNAEGTNCIIWSKDKDLTQLVNVDNDGCFTICWNKDSGVTAMNKPEEEMDFFFNLNYSENSTLYQEICKKSTGVTLINPKSIALDKIIRGDGGDNILPIIIRKSKTDTSTKKFRVSKKDICDTLDIYNDSEIKEYISSLFENKSYKDRIEHTENEVFEHFLYNRKLVTLDKKNYDNDVLEKFNSYEGYNTSSDLSKAYSIITAQKNDIENVLETI